MLNPTHGGFSSLVGVILWIFGFHSPLSYNVVKLIPCLTLQVVALDTNLPVKEAFSILYEQVNFF